MNKDEYVKLSSSINSKENMRDFIKETANQIAFAQMIAIHISNKNDYEEIMTDTTCISSDLLQITVLSDFSNSGSEFLDLYKQEISGKTLDNLSEFKSIDLSIIEQCVKDVRNAISDKIESSERHEIKSMDIDDLAYILGEEEAEYDV